MRFLLILAPLALLLAGSPAFAWDYEETQGEDDAIMVGAWDDAADGYELAVECDDTYTAPDLYVFTPERWDDTTSYADEVPLTVTVDGVPTGPLDAHFENSNGEVAVAVYSDDDDRVWTLIEALQHSEEGVEVSFFDKTARFGVEAAADSIGKAVRRCNELDGE